MKAILGQFSSCPVFSSDTVVGPGFDLSCYEDMREPPNAFMALSGGNFIDPSPLFGGTI
jgi:hypothetical protein